MKQVGSTWIPFFKGDGAESGMAASTQRINDLIADHEVTSVALRRSAFPSRMGYQD